MASFNYLWAHRAKFPINSKAFYYAWGKRFFSFPELFRRNRRSAKLKSKGANIHPTAEIGKANIEGRLHLLSIGKDTFIGRVTMAVHDEISIGERVA